MDTNNGSLSPRFDVQFYRNAVRNLRNMHKLRNLHTQLEGLPANVLQLLRGTNYNLESFTCTEPLDQRMLRFLEKQPEIADLVILNPSVSEQVEELPSSCLPKLHTLHCITPNEAAVVVPGRPVCRLEIQCWIDTKLEAVLPRFRISNTLSSFLVAQGFRVAVKDLNLITTYFPRLRFLGECWFTEEVGGFLFIILV